MVKKSALLVYYIRSVTVFWWHSDDDRKFYMWKYNKQIFAVFYI